VLDGGGDSAAAARISIAVQQEMASSPEIEFWARMELERSRTTLPVREVR